MLLRIVTLVENNQVAISSNVRGISRTKICSVIWSTPKVGIFVKWGTYKMLRLLHRVVRNMQQHGIYVFLVKFSVFVGYLGFWYVLPVFWYYLVYSPMLGITKVSKLALLGHFLCFSHYRQIRYCVFTMQYGILVCLDQYVSFWLFWPVSGDFAICHSAYFWSLIPYNTVHLTYRFLLNFNLYFFIVLQHDMHCFFTANAERNKLVENIACYY